MPEGSQIMRKDEKAKIIRDTGVIAIMRANSPQSLIQATEAIKQGGVRAIEVTMTTPGALDVIKEAKEKIEGEILFGAGSVLGCETARIAILAGADFIVSPSLDKEMIHLCNRYGIPVISGCFTPSEMIIAWESGATFIKLFPASIVSQKMIKAVLAPFPQLEIIPVGGIHLDNALDYIKNGAVALGVGSSLVNDKLLESGDYEEITDRAEQLISLVKKGRRG